MAYRLEHHSAGDAVVGLGQLGLVDSAARLIAGPPRDVLSLFGLTVGNDPAEQWRAIMILSAFCLCFSMTVYISLTVLFCRVRRRGSAAAADSGDAPTHQEMLWTVHNKRYDLRDFVQRHPGGSYAIMLGRGRNCTEMFKMYHSLADVSA